ncbi:MAG: EscU/YscU/HrcU family type III secretion system export apparatus switch protein [Pseudomonadota bacterium]
MPHPLATTASQVLAVNDKSGDPDDLEIAFALQSADGRAETTRLVARGEGELAEEILALALSHGVPVRQDADLASLLDTVELDSDIPLPALAAVAEILTYLYQIKDPAVPSNEAPRSSGDN